ncbi:hypothetical protein [Sinorhizobium meliloti]|uniref:hypothetical protein n=1 Tax=Rhizobium meliloti TaxID=382 RepID=UPI000FDADFE0|nr:hypothetical protein [Sinorhizobium meliloti]RVQ08165.1 hypothetical protein CN069_01775 [Sinorhizobium meliloti]
MFVTFLRFAENRTGAPDFMSAHNDWIAQGFADGVFFCVGSLQAAAGGAPKFSAFTATGSPNRSVSLVPLIGQKRWRYIF